MELSEKDIERLAKKLAPELIDQVQKNHHEFWIDPEAHYNAHRDISEMITDYRKAKGIFWNVFIGAVALSAIIAAAWAFINPAGRK